jgi:hypothetical protein
MNSSIANESEIVINKPVAKKTNKKAVNVQPPPQPVTLESVLAIVESVTVKEKETVVKEEKEKADKLVLQEAKNAEKIAKKESLALASLLAKQAKKDAIILENEVEDPTIDLDLTPEVKQLLDNVLTFAHSELDEMYEKGKDLTGIPLKVFSGEALETFSRKIIERCFTIMGIENGKVNQEYLSDPENILDNQRLDQHVYIGDKIVLMQEDRAWVDKPFYTLKRGVIQDIMKLPFCMQKMHPNIKFVILSYTVDVTNKTKITQDQTKGFGDITKDFSINCCRRGTFKNWYEGGYSKNNIKQYIKFVVTHLIQFK